MIRETLTKSRIVLLSSLILAVPVSFFYAPWIASALASTPLIPDGVTTSLLRALVALFLLGGLVGATLGEIDHLTEHFGRERIIQTALGITGTTLIVALSFEYLFGPYFVFKYAGTLYFSAVLTATALYAGWIVVHVLEYRNRAGIAVALLAAAATFTAQFGVDNPVTGRLTTLIIAATIIAPILVSAFGKIRIGRFRDSA